MNRQKLRIGSKSPFPLFAFLYDCSDYSVFRFLLDSILLNKKNPAFRPLGCGSVDGIKPPESAA